MSEPHVAYHVPGEGMAPDCLDFVKEDGKGGWLCFYSQCTFSELLAKYPAAIIETQDNFIRIREAALTTAPIEITEESYSYALGCLPPLDWHKVSGIESFKSSEFYSGRITSIYATDARRCWSFRDVASLTAELIAEKIKALETWKAGR